MTLTERIPADWRAVLGDAITDPKFAALEAYLTQERASYEVFPPEELTFEALRLTPLHSVRAVIVGQDPYLGNGQAHGLAFSVPSGVKPPPSLRNILTELAQDARVPAPEGRSLIPWAEHGVLLLNTVRLCAPRRSGPTQVAVGSRSPTQSSELSTRSRNPLSFSCGAAGPDARPGSSTRPRQ
jgi:uracil-DNA glycosylase